MPDPTRTARGIRLREQALDLMAAAIGEDAYRGGKNDRPNYGILTGSNSTGKATRLVGGESPAAETIAIVGQRYAAAAGIEDFWQAVGAMFEPVDADGLPFVMPRRPRRRVAAGRVAA